MKFSPIIEKIRSLVRKIPSLAAAIATFLGGFFGRAGAFLSEMPARIGRAVKENPAEYRRPAMIAAAVIAVILLLTTIVTVSVGKTGKREVSGTVNIPSEQFIIPSDELFLPDEPDFIPGVMTEREQRAAWTEEDAEPWWRDPLKNGGQNWLDVIEKTVDEIFEGVP